MKRREPGGDHRRRPGYLKRYDAADWPGEESEEAAWQAWVLGRQAHAALYPGMWPDEVDRARELRRERQARAHRMWEREAAEAAAVEVMEQQLLAEGASRPRQTRDDEKHERGTA